MLLIIRASLISFRRKQCLAPPR